MTAPDDLGQNHPQEEPSQAKPQSWLMEAWKNPFNRFVARFLFYLAIVSYLFPKLRFGFPALIHWMSESAASIVYGVVNPFAEDVRHFDSVVTLGSFNITVIDECTGVYEMLIYAAAVFAYPTQLRHKVSGLLMGLPILYAMNVLRILMLLIVGYQFPDLFDFMHLYFWQGTLVIMVSAVWLLWVILMVPNDTKNSPAHS